MTRTLRFLCVTLTLALGACASSIPVHYVSLDNGQPSTIGSQRGLRIAVTRINLPEAVDRPQLVVRTAGHELRLSEQYEWVEPLRQQIPRVIARELGRVLDSSRVVALPIDSQDYDLEFKVMLDVQRMEVIAGQGVDLDVVWRADARDGRGVFGRSVVREAIEANAKAGDHQAVVAAQSRAWRIVAGNIASGITGWLNETELGGLPTDLNTIPLVPSRE